jgi:alkyldihydroxyacetonephosphate synthase
LSADARTRSFWHWGFEEDFPDEAARGALAQMATALIPELGALRAVPLPRVDDAKLREPRIASQTPPRDRIIHAGGKGYRDILRAFRLDFAHAPDVVLYPERDEDIAAAFELCAREGAALVPFGGGTSVTSGVTYDGKRPVVCVDLGKRRRVLDVDKTSRLVRIEGGATGPDLEAQLAEHGLTLRFYPQSFELSTLGGWIATRAGGHFATGYTHIDDMVASLGMLSPSGAFETKTLPASGAGPDPNRLVLGSEGALGIVTEATVRAFVRPIYRASATVFFDALPRAVDAARAIAQSGLQPSACRVLDQNEALMSRVSGSECALVLGFESADHELVPWMDRALKLAVRAGGVLPEPARHQRGDRERKREGAADTWRSAFLRGPYLQSALVPYGVMVDTFETACTWARFESLDREVRAALEAELGRWGGGLVAMRFSHVYPDGPAPYYTFGVRADRGRELEQHDGIKRAVSDALVRAGGTITHHHAVGRLHARWYEGERPAPYERVLRAAKHALDPAAIMNPGVLLREE